MSCALATEEEVRAFLDGHKYGHAEAIATLTKRIRELEGTLEVLDDDLAGRLLFAVEDGTVQWINAVHELIHRALGSTIIGEKP